MGNPQAIRTRACPTIKWELSRKNHLRRPVYKQVTLSSEERVLRSLKFRMAHISRKYASGFVSPEMLESRKIARHLALKITLAANVFYLSIGLILFFLLNMKSLPADARPPPSSSSNTEYDFFEFPVLPAGEFIALSGMKNVYSRAEAAQNQDYLITINGQVTHMIEGQPSDYHPLTKIYFFYPGDIIPLDSSQTDENGNYMKTMNYVGIKEKYSELIPGIKTLGNPFREEAKINIGVFENDKYTLRVFDLSGKAILSQDIDLYEGDNLVSVSGLGNAGVKIISVSNGKETYTEKIIQSSPGTFSPRIDIISTSSDSKNLKNLEFLTDSLLIRYVTPESYPEYYDLEKIVEAKTSTVNATMQQKPKTYSFTIYGYNLNEGESVGDSASLKITWGDGTTNIYNSDSEGIIHILRENTLDTALNVYFENPDTTFFQEWIAGVKRENLITTREKNLFQNEKEQSPGPIPQSDVYIPPTPAPANLNNFPDTFEVYMIQRIVYDSEGQPHNTRGKVFRTVVSCARGPPDWVKKWEKGQYDKTYLYEMQTYETKKNMQGDTLNFEKYLNEHFLDKQTLEYITPEESALQSQALDSLVAQGFYLRQNGRQLFSEFERVLVYDGTESEWLAGQARGWDQIHISQYGFNNGNGCTFTLDSTFSDYYRFKNGIAHYDIYSNMTYKIAEMVESSTHCRDPPNGNLGGKITDASGNFTSFGTTMTHMIYIFDPGTIFW